MGQIKEVLPKVFVLDVDGVLTTGRFFYNADGKVLKEFGPDDSDALHLMKSYIEIHFVTGDKKGFPISKKRVEDMGFPITLVSTLNRIQWIKEKWEPEKVVYMGDGIFDHYVFKAIAYSIAPANADSNALNAANFVTKRAGGDRAVAEACLHLLEKFFEPYDSLKLPRGQNKTFGEWSL